MSIRVARQLNCASKETYCAVIFISVNLLFDGMLCAWPPPKHKQQQRPNPEGLSKLLRQSLTGGPCLIAEFRLLALTTHDPQERQNKSIEWLQKNNANCSPMQLSILHSSKAALMGTADSMALSAAFDAIMEKRMANNPEALNRYYRPEAQGPARSKTESAAAGADTGAAKPCWPRRSANRCWCSGCSRCANSRRNAR
jgi:hypothetical protein